MLPATDLDLDLKGSVSSRDNDLKAHSDGAYPVSFPLNKAGRSTVTHLYLGRYASLSQVNLVRFSLLFISTHLCSWVSWALGK